MEKFKGYVPQNNGVEIVALREFLRRKKIYEIGITVFPSKGKPFAAFISGWKPTSQYGNPSVQLFAEGGEVIFSGGTAVCKIKDLDKFPKLKEKIKSRVSGYKPKSYRYTEEAGARFLKKKLGSQPSSSSMEK
jgi:hypothetical protein